MLKNYSSEEKADLNKLKEKELFINNKNPDLIKNFNSGSSKKKIEIINEIVENIKKKEIQEKKNENILDYKIVDNPKKL